MDNFPTTFPSKVYKIITNVDWNDVDIFSWLNIIGIFISFITFIFIAKIILIIINVIAILYIDAHLADEQMYLP